MTFRGQDIKGGNIGVDLSPNKMKTSGIYHLPFTCFNVIHPQAGHTPKLATSKLTKIIL